MIWPTLMCLKIHSKMLILFGMFGSPDQKFCYLHFNMSRHLLVLSVILSHSGLELCRHFLQSYEEKLKFCFVFGWLFWNIVRWEILVQPEKVWTLAWFWKKSNIKLFHNQTKPNMPELYKNTNKTTSVKQLKTFWHWNSLNIVITIYYSYVVYYLVSVSHFY